VASIALIIKTKQLTHWELQQHKWGN